MGRDVNRHYYTREEIDSDLQRPVVRALFALIRLRNAHPAFDGEFEIDAAGSVLTAIWTAGEEYARIDIDAASGEGTVMWTEDGAPRTSGLLALGG